MNELLIAIFSILGGGVVGYFVSSNISYRDKKREIILSYLIDVYKSLENSAHRKIDGEEFERAIGIIQLFGTKHQIELVKKFAHEFADKNTACFDELLNDLRNSLRKELKLKKCMDNVVHLRIKSNTQ